MAVTLIEWTAEDFAARRPAMVTGFAATMAENLGLPPADALVESERQTTELLPDGPRTPGQLMFRALQEDAEVGTLWLSMPGTMYAAMAWVAEVAVEEEARGRGLGREIMLAGEEELLARGIHRVGLNVFGANAVARRLYDRLGYEVVDQVWLLPTAGASSTVRLRPMTTAEFTARRDTAVVTDPVAFTRDPRAGVAQARRAAGEIDPAGARLAEVDGEYVGWVWFVEHGAGGALAATVHYLEVDEDKQRRGYGTGILLAVAAAVADRGPRLVWRLTGAHIAGRALAQKLGMDLANQHMVKDL